MDESNGSWLDSALTALPGTLAGVGGIIAATHAGGPTTVTYVQGGGTGIAGTSGNMLYYIIGAVEVLVLIILLTQK